MKKLRKLIKNSEHKQQKEQQQLPPTPPVSSVSEDPPTPPLQSANQTNLLSEASSDCCTLSDTKQTNNTPSCDTTSDGDETSSKSTLDLIIPPPKDFEGKCFVYITIACFKIVINRCVAAMYRVVTLWQF